MKKIMLSLSCIFLLPGILSAQESYLQSGPMVGYSTMKEVMLWVQTNRECEVLFEYWSENDTEQIFRTRVERTVAANAFVARCLADQVEPGIKYQYRLIINSQPVTLDRRMQFQTQPLWQWRADPPDFTFVIGSCAYINESQYDRPGEPYGSNYEIFTSIYNESADFMLWMGDNTYLREADWNSRTGILHRYTHTRSTPELQPMLGSMHHYAIWDDHDYGPNDADRSYWLKDVTTETFKLFWANPNYNVTGKGGITGTFHWNDVQFFLLDDRYFRIPEDRRDGSYRTVLGHDQVEWLIDALTGSRASFKFVVVGSQFLNSAASGENFANYPEERQRIIDAIFKSKARGVIFLDGDRHHSELSLLDEDWHYPLYDLTVSPLTAGVYSGANENNEYRVDGTLVDEHNYGLLQVSGPRTQRILKIMIKNKDGKEIWTKEIRAEELK